MLRIYLEIKQNKNWKHENREKNKKIMESDESQYHLIRVPKTNSDK